jgi:hypothetical protein
MVLRAVTILLLFSFAAPGWAARQPAQDYWDLWKRLNINDQEGCATVLSPEAIVENKGRLEGMLVQAGIPESGPDAREDLIHYLISVEESLGRQLTISEAGAAARYFIGDIEL